MDGTNTTRTSRARARTCAAVGAALFAFACSAAPALADPAIDYAPGSALLQEAQGIAQAHWGADACNGQVAISWTALDPSTNASSTWSNPVDEYSDPAENSSCSIVFNSALAWDWAKLCTIVVHEYGHLTGHAHAPDPNDVMYAYYTKPLAECVAATPAGATPDPAPLASDPVALRQTNPPAAKTAAVKHRSTPRHAVHRGVLVAVPTRHGHHEVAHRISAGRRAQLIARWRRLHHAARHRAPARNHDSAHSDVPAPALFAGEAIRLSSPGCSGEPASTGAARRACRRPSHSRAWPPRASPLRPLP